MATPTEEQKLDNPTENQGKPGEEAATTAPLQDEQKKTTKKTELAILNFVIKYLRLVGGALLIWFMGWLGLSYVWLICGFFVYVVWRMNQDERKTRRDAFREATEREHEVVEARMEDLPSWVRKSRIRIENFAVCTAEVKRSSWKNKYSFFFSDPRLGIFWMFAKESRTNELNLKLDKLAPVRKFFVWIFSSVKLGPYALKANFNRLFTKHLFEDLI